MAFCFHCFSGQEVAWLLVLGRLQLQCGSQQVSVPREEVFSLCMGFGGGVCAELASAHVCFLKSHKCSHVWL